MRRPGSDFTTILAASLIISKKSVDMGVKVLFKRWYVPTCVTLAKLMKLKTSERSKTSCVGFAELHEFSDLHVVCSVTLVVLS